MKIFLRPGLCGPARAAPLAADPALTQALGPEPNAAVGHLFKKFFDAGTPVLARILAHAKAEGERMSFLRDVQFTAREIAGASHLEAVCRKTIGQSDAESRTTLADYQSDPLHPTSGRWRVRLPRRMFLGKAVPPETIAHVDQYTGEYVLGSAAADALRSSALEGWQLQPVLHWKTLQPQPQVGMHLTTRALLPPALQCASTFETLDDGPGAPATPRRYGALSYARGALAASPDFARTAEPWCEWSTPQWVVRQRVRSWHEQAGLRGWAFRPVLEEGTPLQREHEERWGSLLEQLRAGDAEISA
jgi:hypothetical protein